MQKNIDIGRQYGLKISSVQPREEIMKRTLSVLVFALVAISLNGPSYAVKKETPTFDYDKSHTSILFFISHVGFSRVVGEFNEYDGYFEFDKDKPEESFVTITIDPKSVDVGHKGLNEEMAGEKFFDVAKYGKIKFVSTKIEKTGDNTGELTGDLTLHGVTKPITFGVIFNKQAEFFGFTKAGFSLKSKIKHSDFGMDWGVPDMLGDEVDILVEAEGQMRKNR